MTVQRVMFETMRPEEQVMLLGRTAVLVGFHGAAQTNAVFMQPDTVIIEMFPFKFTDYRFMDFNIASKRWWIPWYNTHRNRTFMAEPTKYKPEYEPLDDNECLNACARYCYANRRDADTLVPLEEISIVFRDALNKFHNASM